MLYVALDTCVWLALLKVDTNQPHNPFDELMHWFQTGELKCITTRNLINEWERNKELKKQQILNEIRSAATNNPLATLVPLNTIYTPDTVDEKLTKRISRIDALLNGSAEIAEESDEIYVRAAKSNLACLAPNHTKDSFKDTVNYMTLAAYVVSKDYPICYFSTINYTDYSESAQKRENLHPQLATHFLQGKLDYQYFDDLKQTFGGRLFNAVLRRILPDYSKFLFDLRKKEQMEKVAEAEQEKVRMMDTDDPDFLPNTLHLDRIAAKKEPNDLDKIILQHLLEKHPGYKKYFFKKLSENVLV